MRRRYRMCLAGRPFRRNPANHFLPKFWRATLMHDGCVICGQPPTGLDHIDAASRGGTNGWVNRAPMCTRCENMKADAPLLLTLALLARAQRRVLRRTRYSGNRVRQEAAAYSMCKAMLLNRKG